MLLLNEDYISPELKQVLEKIIKQLTELKEITQSPSLQQMPFYKEINHLCTKVVDNEKSIFVVESFFGKDSAKREKLSSLVNLTKEEVKLIEKSYNIHYPGSNALKREDISIYKQAIDFSQKYGAYDFKELKALKDYSDHSLHINLAHHFFKHPPGHINSYSIREFAQELQSLVILNPKIKIQTFNTLFKLPAFKGDLEKTEPVSGVAVFTCMLSHNGPLQRTCLMVDLENYKQLCVKDVLKMGYSLNLNSVDNFHFFTNDRYVYALEKNQPIVATTVAKLQSNSNIKVNGQYGRQDIDFAISAEDFRNPQDLNKQISYRGMEKIRTAIIKPPAPFAKGSILKYGDSLVYVSSYIKATNEGNFEFDSIVIAPENKGDYFFTKLKIDKNNVKHFSATDKVDGLIFFEALNSAYQQEERYVIHEETNKLRYR